MMKSSKAVVVCVREFLQKCPAANTALGKLFNDRRMIVG
jgi:hypothetical protein